jgi:hypothetical protein
MMVAANATQEQKTGAKAGSGQGSAGNLHMIAAAYRAVREAAVPCCAIASFQPKSPKVAPACRS